MTNEEKIVSILQEFGVLPKNYADFELEHAKNHMDWAMLIQMAKWKDEQYEEREEGLREIIDALDARLQKANECGMYYFDKCNIQKQQLIDKACKWLTYSQYRKDNIVKFLDEKFIDEFRKAMEE